MKTDDLNPDWTQSVGRKPGAMRVEVQWRVNEDDYLGHVVMTDGTSMTVPIRAGTQEFIPDGDFSRHSHLVVMGDVEPVKAPAPQCLAAPGRRLLMLSAALAVAGAQSPLVTVELPRHRSPPSHAPSPRETTPNRHERRKAAVLQRQCARRAR